MKMKIPSTPNTIAAMEQPIDIFSLPLAASIWPRRAWLEACVWSEKYKKNYQFVSAMVVYNSKHD